MEVTYDEFKKLNIRIGKIVSAEKVEGADKLIKLQIDFGNETRQIIAGVAHVYKAEELVGKEVPVVVNLEPKKFRGLESQGMILAADDDGKPVLLTPDKEVATGSIVK